MLIKKYRISQSNDKIFKLIAEYHRVPQETNNQWAELIDNAKSGCNKSLGEILESVRSYLLLVAEDELGGHVRAKFGASDIVQHSMLEAHKSICDFRGESEIEFRHWLKKIVVNNLTDEARRYTHTLGRNVSLEVSTDQLQTTAPNTGIETPSWHIRRKEFDQQLALAVAQLPDRQRYVIEARHRHGYEYSQIASQLEISEAGARKIWSRATEQLRCILEDDSE